MAGGVVTHGPPRAAVSTPELTSQPAIDRGQSLEPTRIPASKMLQLRRFTPLIRRTYASYSTSSTTPVPVNEPQQSRTPAVTQTNELPRNAFASYDKPQAPIETVAEAEELRVAQAPNRKTTWSTSQQPRERAMVGPRFEQTTMADQVRLQDILVFKALQGQIE